MIQRWESENKTMVLHAETRIQLQSRKTLSITNFLFSICRTQHIWVPQPILFKKIPDGCHLVFMNTLPLTKLDYWNHNFSIDLNFFNRNKLKVWAKHKFRLNVGCWGVWKNVKTFTHRDYYYSYYTRRHLPPVNG